MPLPKITWVDKSTGDPVTAEDMAQIKSVTNSVVDAVETGSNDGQDGQDGQDGLSAYAIAVQGGFVGTQSQWLESLKGAPGEDGNDGQDGSDAVVSDERIEGLALETILAPERFSTNGNIQLSRDGDAIRADLNTNLVIENPSAIPDEAGALLTRQAADDRYSSKMSTDAAIAALVTAVNALGGSVLAPTQAPGLVAWFRAGAGVTIVDGKVDEWLDQSPNGNNLVAASAPLRPTRFNAGGPNNKPYIGFDGTNALWIPGFNLNSKKTTVIVVFSADNAQAGNVLVEITGDFEASYGGMLINMKDPVDTLTVWHVGALGYGAARADFVGTGWRCLQATGDTDLTAAEIAYTLDDTPAAAIFPGDTGTDVFTGPLYLGSRGNVTGFAQMNVSEFIICSEALTPAQMAPIRTYLNTEYALNLTP